MSIELPEIVSREEWLAARKVLLAKEKEVTRARDAVSAERRRLPMVGVDKGYVFEGPEGKVRLIDLFDGRRQLIVYHFMFAPDWDEGCPSCTHLADEVSPGHFKHLQERDVSFACTSRAPLTKLEAYKVRKGWTFPWYSSSGSDFNYDFQVTLDESVAPIVYNYRTRESGQAPHITPTATSLSKGQASACSCATATVCFTPTPPTDGAAR